MGGDDRNAEFLDLFFFGESKSQQARLEENLKNQYNHDIAIIEKILPMILSNIRLRNISKYDDWVKLNDVSYFSWDVYKFYYSDILVKVNLLPGSQLVINTCGSTGDNQILDFKKFTNLRYDWYDFHLTDMRKNILKVAKKKFDVDVKYEWFTDYIDQTQPKFIRTIKGWLYYLFG